MLDAATSSEVDAPSDVVADEEPDAVAEVVTDGSVCPSVAEECADAGATGHPCVASWSRAQVPSTWCSMFPSYRVAIATDCGGYDLVVVAGIDTSTFYYYDLDTGALVGIEGHGAVGGGRCIAGRAPRISFADCGDGGAVLQSTCLNDGAVRD